MLSSVQRETCHSAVFVCDGTSESVGALLANIMFFDYCDADTRYVHSGGGTWPR